MKNIRLIYTNVDGVEIDETFFAEELELDYWAECMCAPANDDEVMLVEIDGVDVTNKIDTGCCDTIIFLDVVKYLGWK